jgi:hypothetical protein
VFAALIFGVLAIYFYVGWLIIAALDRRLARRRSGGMLWIGILFWPITVVVDLFVRGGPNRG